MSGNPMHEHIRAAAAHSAPERLRLTARMLGECWPGGASDRTEPAARAWLRGWRPSRLGATIPACSCTDGRCRVCN